MFFVTGFLKGPVNKGRQKIKVMNLIGIALMVFSMVLLVVSVYYINATTRHKERMALIERGEDVKKIFNKRSMLDAVKLGMAGIGAGLGFLTGVILEDSNIFHSGIELPLYYAPIFLYSGLSLLLFYRLFGNKYDTDG